MVRDTDDEAETFEAANTGANDARARDRASLHAIRPFAR